MDTEMESPRTCSACGAELQPGNRYCANCGTAVAQVPQTEPPTTDSDQGADAPMASETTPHPPGDAPDPYGAQADTDPSTFQTREFITSSYAPADDPRPEAAQSTGPASPYSAGDPDWGTPETTVQPERGNRTLWIILGIFAVIVLICCCILPLGLMAIANWDTGFQDELRSTAGMLLA